MIGSSFHTLSLPNVLARYPEVTKIVQSFVNRCFQLVFFQAKVIGAPQAEDKLNYINALVRGKFDFNASNKEELAAANKELEEEGVQLFFVDGDVCTNALLAIAHDHLLACDLVYGRSAPQIKPEIK